MVIFVLKPADDANDGRSRSRPISLSNDQFSDTLESQCERCEHTGEQCELAILSRGTDPERLLLAHAQ